MESKKCCLKCQVCKNTKNLKKLQKQVIFLQNQINKLNDVVQLSEGSINIGTNNNPVNNIFTNNIVSNDFSLKGINIDDTTALLKPSFNSFPQNWLIANTPISSFRTYHYNSNNSAWIKWGVQNNIQVMVGITLDNYKNEIDLFSADYSAADEQTKSQYNLYIIAIAIGNEQGIDKISLMREGMLYAKNSILPKNAKITTVLKESPDWISPTYPPINARFTDNFLQLEPNMDIICFNMYDGYTNPEIPLDVRLSWISNKQQNIFSLTLNGFGAIRFAIMAAGIVNKPFWCTEFGWRSSGDISGSTVQNLKTFYNNFLNFNMNIPFYPQESLQTTRSPDRLFYFTIRDANDETFGLYTSNQNLTPKI